MMKEHMTEQLSLYIDNELSDNERKSVEKHIDDCSLCQEELQALQMMRFELQGAYRDLQPTDDLVHGIMNQISLRKKSRKAMQLSWIGFSVFALILIGLVIQLMPAIKAVYPLILTFVHVSKSLFHTTHSVVTANNYVTGLIICVAVITIVVTVRLLMRLLDSLSLELRGGTE